MTAKRCRLIFQNEILGVLKQDAQLILQSIKAWPTGLSCFGERNAQHLNSRMKFPIMSNFMLHCIQML